MKGFRTKLMLKALDKNDPKDQVDLDEFQVMAPQGAPPMGPFFWSFPEKLPVQINKI